MTDVFTLKKENGNNYSLWKNDAPTNCMKSNLVPVPHPMTPNQVTLVPRPCNSACPFFLFAEKVDKNDADSKINGVVLKCMDKPLFVEMKEDAKKEIKSNLTINTNNLTK